MIMMRNLLRKFSINSKNSQMYLCIHECILIHSVFGCDCNRFQELLLIRSDGEKNILFKKREQLFKFLCVA